MRDISFSTKEGRFNFRVSAYVTCGDKMLLQYTDKVGFANLIGGRVHVGENSVDAIVREVKEEIGVSVKKPKLLLTAENFFEWCGENVHEMVFFYQIEVAKKYLKQLDNALLLDHKDQHTKWVEKSKIKNYDCRPVLIYKLPSLEQNNFVTHFVTHAIGK